MAEATVTALPLGRPDELCPLRTSGPVPVMLVRWGCRIFSIAGFGTEQEQVITVDSYSSVDVAKYAFGRHPLLKIGAPATVGAA